jgi:aspartate/methionine/tyrosine aminotransferase
LLFQVFDYMRWAKTAVDESVRYNLAGSGFTYTDPAVIAPDLSRVELFSTRGYGSTEIRAHISARYGVPEGHVLPVAGTSLGIFLGMAAGLKSGDEVLVEMPAYEPLFKVPLSLGAQVTRFDRTLSNGFEIDPSRLEREITPRTRMIAISDLHNPSGRALCPDVRRRLLDLCSRHGITLFVDEVYRDFLETERPETIYAPGAPVVVSSSLTKVYGMGGLRAGWVFGAPDLIRNATHVMDLLQVNDPYPMVPFIEAAFRSADRLRAEGQEVARKGREVLSRWMEARTDLRWVPPDAGLTAFPQLPEGVTGTRVSEVLKRDEATLVVPGRFFEDDRHIRIGVGAGPDLLHEGLIRLGRVLDRLQRT